MQGLLSGKNLAMQADLEKIINSFGRKRRRRNRGWSAALAVLAYAIESILAAYRKEPRQDSERRHKSGKNDATNKPKSNLPITATASVEKNEILELRARIAREEALIRELEPTIVAIEQEIADLEQLLNQLVKQRQRNERRLEFRLSLGSHASRFVLATCIPTFAALAGGFAGFMVWDSLLAAVIPAVLLAAAVAYPVRSFLFDPSVQELKSRAADFDVRIAEFDEQLSKLASQLLPVLSKKCKRQVLVRELSSQLTAELNVERRRLEETDLLSENWRVLRSGLFEDFLRRVFEHLGYEVEVKAGAGDQGIDLIVSGSGKLLGVQAKGYEGSVGNSAVQQAYAGMAYYGCEQCVVATNSRFTNSALTLAKRTDCLLIAGDDILDLIKGKIVPSIS